MNIPLAIPNVGEEERSYLNQCIDTGFVSSVGQFVTDFEKKLADYCHSQFAVAVNSGTSALHLMLLAAGVKENDLVIMPSYTFIASANAVSYCNAEPWFFDIDDNHLTLSPEQILEGLESQCEIRSNECIHVKTQKRVKAILPVFTAGMTPDIEGFQKISESFGLSLVFDAAPGIGAKYKDSPLGQFQNDFSFSFNGNKTITCGGGGAIITNSKDRFEYLKHISTTARTSQEYDHDYRGFNYRMTNVEAAIGLAQLEKLDQFLHSKKKTREFYQDLVNNQQNLHIYNSKSFGDSYWFTLLRFTDSPEKADHFLEFFNAKGIMARKFWKPMQLLSPYKENPTFPIPVSKKLYKEIVCLPCSSNLSNEELEYIKSVFLDWINDG